MEGAAAADDSELRLSLRPKNQHQPRTPGILASMQAEPGNCADSQHAVGATRMQEQSRKVLLGWLRCRPYSRAIVFSRDRAELREGALRARAECASRVCEQRARESMGTPNGRSLLAPVRALINIYTGSVIYEHLPENKFF